MLWSTGALTVENVREAKASGDRKAIKLPAMINPSTGRQSARHTAFSDLSWGKITTSYLSSILKHVDNIDMGHIMDKAKEFSKAVSCNDNESELLGSVDPDDERANLAAGSGMSCGSDDSEGENEHEENENAHPSPSPPPCASRSSRPLSPTY